MLKLITPLTQVDSSAAYTVGSTTKTKDGNEYIYLKGNASGTTYGLVSYDEDYASSAVATGTAASLMGSFAIAMANINTTSKYGWYIIKGEGSGKAAGAVTDNTRLQPTATAGYVDDTTSGTVVVIGLWARETAGGSGSTFAVQLDYPKLIDVTLT